MKGLSACWALPLQADGKQKEVQGLVSPTCFPVGKARRVYKARAEAVALAQCQAPPQATAVPSAWGTAKSAPQSGTFCPPRKCSRLSITVPLPAEPPGPRTRAQSLGREGGGSSVMGTTERAGARTRALGVTRMTRAENRGSRSKSREQNVKNSRQGKRQLQEQEARRNLTN